MLRRCGCLVALPLLLLALAGHAWYWYFPRLRPAAPDPGDFPGRLLTSGAYETCVWLPYPHQNLAAFAKNLPDPQAFTAALARLAEVPEPELPGFGPFAVPPADEITACADRSGQSCFVAARIYPALAGIAKVAAIWSFFPLPARCREPFPSPLPRELAPTSRRGFREGICPSTIRSSRCCCAASLPIS